jgi:penicillin-binding protein 1A
MQIPRRLRWGRRRLRLAGPLLIAAVLASGCKVMAEPTQDELTLPTLSQTSLLYDDQGTVIRSFHRVENRTLVSLEQVPPIVRDAVLAIEDQRFYSHRGIDVKALIRAAYNNAKEGRIVQGGSTITEQLVKNTITGGERTIDRKVREAMIAYQLEQEHSKDWILEQYLNTVYFGRGAYGIQAAARTYFGKPAGKLSLGQGAMLAGLIRSPATYDPTVDPEAAIARRNQVLERMQGLAMIDDETYEAAIQRDVKLSPAPDSEYPAPYFVQHVTDWFVGQPAFGPDARARWNLLFTGGLRIYTTVNLGMQKMAEDAIKGVLTQKSDPHGSMTVLDPRNGEIKAMVGGRNFFALPREDQFAKVNLATFKGGTGRQAGSAFKPFALVAALENSISPQQKYPAPPKIDIELPPDCEGKDGPIWEVNNYEGVAGGRPTLELATVKSLNVVYAQLVEDLGRGDPCLGGQLVTEAAARMGIKSPLAPVPSATLGTNAVNTLEMASAYGTLATIGRHTEPTPVTRITDAQGNVLYEANPKLGPVVEPAIAWTAVDIMRKIVQYGTGAAADIGRPAAGKTGTAQQWRDAWFVGFVPQLVAAVWVGFPQGEIDMVWPKTRLGHVTGGSWPAMIWHDFMMKATSNLPVLDFVQPDVEFVSVAIDIENGCLPNAFTLRRNIQVVQYVKGFEPTETCDDEAQEITVPSVVGLQREEAIGVLQDYAFQVAVKFAESPAKPDLVLSQSPGGGTQAFQGSTITITVAKPVGPPPPGSGDVKVPAVLGLTVAGAISALKAAGFAVKVVEEWECRPPDSCGAEPRVVWDQDPNGSTKAKKGSTVTIWANPGS